MTNFSSAFLLVLLFAGSHMVSVVHGTPQYQNAIPNGAFVLHEGASWPAVGHVAPNGSPTLNPFGMAFLQAGHTWTTALCQMDSDGDGRTNGEELGDPECVWTRGATPARMTDITHPGLVTEFAPVVDDEEEEEEVVVGGGNETVNVDDPNDGQQEEEGGDAAPQEESVTLTRTVAQLELPDWLVWHIALMMLSWGFLLPLGALMAISLRGPMGQKVGSSGKPVWLLAHVVCQLLGIGAMIAGFVVAFQNVITHFNGTHQTFGLAIFVIGIVQTVTGFVRPNVPKAGEDKSTVRLVWETIHKWLTGRVVIVLAWTNIFMGVNLVRDFYDGAPGNDNILKAMNVIMGLQIGLCVVLTLVSIIYRTQPLVAEDGAMEEKDHVNTTHHGQISGEMDSESMEEQNV